MEVEDLYVVSVQTACVRAFYQTFSGRAVLAQMWNTLPKMSFQHQL